MPNKSIICYTGIGAKSSGVHTDKEFAKIAKKVLAQDCKKSSSACPKDIHSLVKVMGASRSTTKKCNRVVEYNKQIDSAYQKFRIATTRFTECIDKYCPKKSEKAITICGKTHCVKNAKAVVNTRQKHIQIANKAPTL